MFLFPLNNTINAVPLFVNKPAISDEILIALLKYNSVRTILEPQFGINPIRLVMKEPSGDSFRNIFDR